MNWKTKTDKIRSELSLHQFKFDYLKPKDYEIPMRDTEGASKDLLYGSYLDPLNERMTISNVTNSTLECSTISESEAKSERILNYMDYAIMESKSKDSQADDTSLCYLDSPSTCRSLPGNKDESELKTETRLNHESYVEPNMQSEKMYKFMSESMSLLQATKSDILKIFEEKQNRLQTEAQNERSSDAAAKILDSVEKKRKQLLTEAICKIRSHVDDLEQVSRLF